MPFDPVKAAIFYLLSGLLDAFDGWAARTFNQGKATKRKCFLPKISLHPFSLLLGTSFGAVLDMVTDRYLCYHKQCHSAMVLTHNPLPPRCATLCLIMILCIFYPHCTLIFQVLVVLDISSHWMQMYSSLLHGENTHKVTDLAANPLMRLYYKRVGPTCHM